MQTLDYVLNHARLRRGVEREGKLFGDNIVPVAERFAVSVSWDAIDALYSHWQTNPPRYSACVLGWDLKRLRGDEASEEYALWAMEFDGTTREEAGRQWANFDRVRLP